MSKKREKVDAVIVGLGWAGSLMANELTQAGLNVVAIERGSWRDTSTDFPTTIDTVSSAAALFCSRPPLKP
jgi:gluconate 2-dehydrogenase alpha chain